MANIFQWDDLIRRQRAAFPSFISVREVMLLLAGCLVCCFVTGGTQTHEHNKGHYFMLHEVADFTVKQLCMFNKVKRGLSCRDMN